MPKPPCKSISPSLTIEAAVCKSIIGTCFI